MSLLFDVIKTTKGKSIDKISDIGRKKRLKTCYDCDELLITKNCAKCGCFVHDKTKYLYESCPQNKW
tara:strand:+ start:845 stop:1045 length:201 start_codon:yes stop_codon:yes gene_type:complete